MVTRGTAIAKVTCPHVHDAVPRHRLFHLLDEARGDEVLWIVGPPGAGKTTLVASWLMERQAPGVWYQVDSTDLDLAGFYYHFRSAVERAAPARKTLLPLFTPEYSHDIEGFARRFFRRMIARVRAETILVFDNLHDVDPSATLHQTILAACDEMRNGPRVVIISREPPPSIYSRLVMHGRIRTLAWPDLQLTSDEAMVLAERKGAMKREDVFGVLSATGGWIAAFMLALDSHDSTSGLPGVGQSMEETVFDYFATEILDRMDEESRTCLVTMALLPQMTVGVCESLTKSPRVGGLLDALYRRQLFTDRRSGAPVRFTFHPLFRRFLLDRFHRQWDRAAVRRLQRRAAALLEADGEAESAFRLWCESAAWPRASSLLNSIAPWLLAQGRYRTLEDWVGALPPAFRATSAHLHYWAGMARLSTAPKEARQSLERAHRIYREEGSPSGVLLAASAVAQGLYLEAAQFKELHRWFNEMETTLRGDVEFPSAGAELQVFSGVLIAVIFAAPGHPISSRCTRRIVELIDEVGDPNQIILAAAITMLFCLYTGEFRLARALERQVERHLAAPELTALNAALWYCYLAYLSVAEHTPERGFEAVARAEEIAEREGFGYVLTTAYSGRSALMRVGDVDRWLALAAPSGASARPYDTAHYLGNVLYRAADCGDWKRAAEFIEPTMRYLENTGTDYQRLIWEVPSAWALAELGFHEEAEHHIAVSETLMAQTRADCYLALVLLGRANVMRCAGRQTEYVRALRDGFGAAARDYAAGRYAFWVPTAGAPRLCADALARNIEPEFVRAYIREYPIAPPDDAPEAWPWRVRVYTLGRFELVVDDRPVVFPHKQPRRPLEVLKALIAFGETGVPMQKLADALWSGDGDLSMNALDVALTRLRRIIGIPEALRTEDRIVRLDPSCVWTDARAFESMTRFEHAPDRLGNDSAARVFALYRGTFLETDADAAWALSRRERLHGRFVQWVLAGAEACEARTDHAAALTWYRKGLETDDLVEAFYQGAMRCHLLLGQSDQGVRMFDRMRERFLSQLATGPSSASESLLRTLRTAS